MTSGNSRLQRTILCATTPNSKSVWRLGGVARDLWRLSDIPDAGQTQKPHMYKRFCWQKVGHWFETWMSPTLFAAISLIWELRITREKLNWWLTGERIPMIGEQRLLFYSLPRKTCQNFVCVYRELNNKITKRSISIRVPLCARGKTYLQHVENNIQDRISVMRHTGSAQDR